MSEIATERGTDTVDAMAHISELTGAKIRVFLTEVAEGVSNYRSLHSLTEQVEHQYHGRFLIELIQNAHDTFEVLPSIEQQNRIEIIFDPSDSPYGTLFVANDGRPFSASNFERLSQLGQSDKDPQKNIGNKGIGFRSVLEISECPEIYSRAFGNSQKFNGYCFAFSPEVVQSLVGPITSLAEKNFIPSSPISGKPLVDWSDEMLVKFRKRVNENEPGWLKGEAKFLSPYLLPVPLLQCVSTRVLDFEKSGFATVVRLPLKSKELCAYVIEHMKKLLPSTVLFLNKVSRLSIRVIEGDEIAYERTTSNLDGDPTAIKVMINDGVGETIEYGIWSKSLHVPNASDEFRAAVRALPGRWPEILDIPVSVAVRLGDIPDKGMFNIYLPTFVPTGSAAHVNAPFFGDMSRTSIPFDDAFNLELLETAGELALDVMRNRLAGKGPIEAMAIIDLLAPFDEDKHASDRWNSIIEHAALRGAALIDHEPLILAESGWCSLGLTSLVPAHQNLRLLTEKLLRRHATFDIFHSCLNSRTRQLKALASSRYGDVGAFPLTCNLALTIESIATEILDTGGDWNLFWNDVVLLLPKGQDELAKCKVLIGSDGKLHSSDAKSKVFFIPRQGTQDDSDVGNEGSSIDVPSSLQNAVAFLNDDIQLYDAKRTTTQTEVRAYLGGGLVSQFRIATVFNEALKTLTPSLPIPIGGEHDSLCRDILVWSLRLIENVVGVGRATDAIYVHLRRIPVPCQGGWFYMEESSFGDGWLDTSGPTLSRYLKALKSFAANENQERLLLPPDNPLWGGIGISAQYLLSKGGVVDGLRLYVVEPDKWNSEFQISPNQSSLPTLPPPNFKKEQWHSYKEFVQTEIAVRYTGTFTYFVGALVTFAGFAEVQNMDDDVRLLLSELIMQSLENWERALSPLEITKRGGFADRQRLTSPLKYFLQSTPWFGFAEAKAISWTLPSDRWHVPANVLGTRSHHFLHLKALPAMIAKRLDMNPKMASVLHRLGLPYFDLNTETASSKLLEALTKSIGSEDAPTSDVHFGQIRDAWNCFRPLINHPPIMHLVVRRSDKQLEAVSPTNEVPLYLPDLDTYVRELIGFNIPVLSIYPKDAKALKDWFVAAYGARVQLTSELELVPYVNGAIWSGVSAVQLAESELGWLIRPLLAMVAFYGQFRGIHSTTFQEHVDDLRLTFIDWVPSVRVAIMRGEKNIVTTEEVDAFWDAKRKTIVASELCRQQPGKLGTVLAQALQRDDLDLPIRHVLGKINSIDAEPDDLAFFLSPINIASEQLQQVIEHLRGDAAHMARLIYVLATILLPAEDVSSILNAKTEEELRIWLVNIQLPDLDIEYTINTARESRDQYDFGQTMWRKFGDMAALDQWNNALHRIKDPILVNRNWATQLRAGIEESSGLVKRILANQCRLDDSLSFQTQWSAFNGLLQTVDYGSTHWEVDFQAAMNLIAELIQSWNCEKTLVDLARESTSIQNLRERLKAIDFNFDIDPDECLRKNHALVDSVANDIDKMRLAWWLKTCPGEIQGDWKSNINEYRSMVLENLTDSAFVQNWTEFEVFALMRSACHQAEFADFQFSMSKSLSFSDLQIILQLSDEEIANVENKLVDLKNEASRKRSIVKVCDEDFDSSADNLDQLWDLMEKHLSDDLLAEREALDLGTPLPLTKLKAKGNKRHTGNTSKSSKKAIRQSKAVDELVGLAGEIFVYRMLQQKYGQDVVTPSSWVSENSKYRYPSNNTNDGMGCDFAFVVKGMHFKVEVKSTAGDDEAFKLGSTEIRLAMELASKGKRKREKFILVQVKNALTKSPTAVVLPNPYDPKFAELFVIEEADARVRYRSEKT